MKHQDPIERFYNEYDWFVIKPKLKKQKKEVKMPCGKKKGGKK